MLRVFWLIAALGVAAPEAMAQYFSRNSVQLPSVGWLAMDSSFGAVNDVKWGLNDQFQIGTGYARDLVDLKLWWLNETALGFGNVNLPGAPSSRVAVSFHGATGFKYNFRTERWRPFVGLMFEILQIFNTHARSEFLFELATPTWGGFRPMLGLEWIFSNDMSVEAEAGYILLMNFEDPVRHSAMGRFAYRIYF